MKVTAISLLSMALAAQAIPSAASAETILLRASRILDGRGGVLEDREIVVREGLIADIVPRGAGSGDRVYDLTAMAVLPGYIDTHVHISRHFDPNGKLHAPEDWEELGHITLHGAENAYRTLMSGVTTVQSLGSEEDSELKAWIARGEIPGPRLFSSLGAVRAGTGSPEEIRAYVRDRAAAGADVVKIFASKSIRLGGVTDMSAEQLEAACGEARRAGASIRGPYAPRRRRPAGRRGRLHPDRARLDARAGRAPGDCRERHVLRQSDSTCSSGTTRRTPPGTTASPTTRWKDSRISRPRARAR